jgi:hypothetical protein
MMQVANIACLEWKRDLFSYMNGIVCLCFSLTIILQQRGSSKCKNMQIIMAGTKDLSKYKNV